MSLFMTLSAGSLLEHIVAGARFERNIRRSGREFVFDLDMTTGAFDFVFRYVILVDETRLIVPGYLRTFVMTRPAYLPGYGSVSAD